MLDVRFSSINKPKRLSGLMKTTGGATLTCATTTFNEIRIERMQKEKRI
jgi:hypothetical protein